MKAVTVLVVETVRYEQTFAVDDDFVSDHDALTELWTTKGNHDCCDVTDRHIYLVEQT